VMVKSSWSVASTVPGAQRSFQQLDWWNLTLKFNRNLSCEILLYIQKICKNRNSFCYRLNAIKCTVYLRKVTGSVTYTVKTGTL
jgi:hypothetical protein